jgi:superfamily II DNA or RNA helicase
VSSLLRTTYPYGRLRSCPAAIRLLPYQLEPALAMFMCGEVRMLVADDVGLGKTVEAALIVTELSARNPRARTLILCPASIREQWKQELTTLFHVEAIQADSAWLREVTQQLPPAVNPWSLPGTYVASMDFVKRPEALHPLERVSWDLLVVDEAHNATPTSDRRAAVHSLALRSSRVVLLTATPHSGDEGDFAALCQLGAAPGDTPIVLFRRARADTNLPATSPRTIAFSVRLTAAERRTHRLLEEYTCRLWREAKGRSDPGGQLLAVVLRKRALSSPASLATSVRRRLQLLDGQLPAPAQLWLPLENDDCPGDQEAGDEVLGREGLRDGAEERVVLDGIRAAAEEASRNESKLRVLRRFLRRTAEPAIVFTEYRDTAEHVGQALRGGGGDVHLLHGGLTRAERHAILKRFTSSGCVLVATDAASEGLNLQHRCRLLLHFELPWSPLRLQQRCGRLDRLGQQRRVHEIALVANDTCEQFVLGPLLQRSSRASAFGGSSLACHFRESRVAACVFGEAEPGSGTEAAPGGAFTRTLALGEAARDEAARLALLRRLAPQREARRRKGGPIVSIARVRRGIALRNDFTLLIFVSLRHGGAPFERLPLLVAARTGGRWRPRAAALKEQVQTAVKALRPQLDIAVERFGRERLSGSAAARAAAADALRKRNRNILQQVNSAARELVQTGLFDRRAGRRAGARIVWAQIQRDELAIQEPPNEDVAACTADYELGAVYVGGRL